MDPKDKKADEMIALLESALATKEAIQKIKRTRKAPLKKWETRILEKAEKALSYSSI